MQKTYFRKLLDLYGECKIIGGIAHMLHKDSVKRCLDFRDSIHEENICWENLTYIRNNYEFIRSVVEESWNTVTAPDKRKDSI